MSDHKIVCDTLSLLNVFLFRLMAVKKALFYCDGPKVNEGSELNIIL